MSFWWRPELNQLLESSNVWEILTGGYAQDRLSEISSKWLVPNQMTFLSMALLLLERERLWPAAVLALAAVDEWMRRMDVKRGLRRAIGCRLSELGGDLTPACESVANSGIVASAHGKMIQRIPRLAAQLAEGDDWLTKGEVAALIEAASSLINSAT